ncbi:MAG: DUF1326 domain-containing protein [Rhizobiales bacterium]|nr:DUF1326 domain-containing protein [Hyphomicrobiales bacterium]
MADTQWMIRGPEIATCNCSYGCPCQFNALPTNGDCRAAVAMQIDEGFFGDVRLDGLRWAAVAAWPGPIHEGHGEIQPIVDVRATPAQRDALLAIMSGQHTKPGATFFQVFSSMIDTVHEPKFETIEFGADVAKATGRFRVSGVVDAAVEPIRNPVTGAAHRAKVSLADSFEFVEAQFASGTVKATAPIALANVGKHAHLANLHLTGDGIVR